MANQIRAVNRWEVLARFEDPGFADDLQRELVERGERYAELFRMQVGCYRYRQSENDL